LFAAYKYFKCKKTDYTDYAFCDVTDQGKGTQNESCNKYRETVEPDFIIQASVTYTKILIMYKQLVER